MPIGQAQTTWFPEMKEMLKKKWRKNYSIPEQFELVKELDEKLNQIRKDGNMKPPICWCYNCQKRSQGRFTQVSITAMYFALEKIGICNHTEFLQLKREWTKYSKVEGINVYGRKKDENIIAVNEQEHNKC